MMNTVNHVVARYKAKKRVKTQDGKEMTIYEYSERQIANRNREKAKRIQALSKDIANLRKQVFKDLTSDDPKKSLVALVVGLMDETYERVGNESSAKEGHFGVTGWQKKHISFGKGKATIKYVGKSGVEQEKTVRDSALLKALRKAYDNAKDGIFSPESGKVSASDVNAYLKDFGVTAKDIRGYHANDVMRGMLQGARKGALPEDKKEREKKLKAEFKQALEATAEAVGHEPATLKSHYLSPGMEEVYLKEGAVLRKFTDRLSHHCVQHEDVPGLEEAYIKDGTVLSKLDKSAYAAPILGQNTFEEEISPILDRFFAKFKDRQLIARIQARYVQAILKQKHRDETDREEWALFDSKGDRVLKWFGPEKPSDERVLKEERRIQYFKHHG